MSKLWASIKKDLLILSRDRIGLTLMFGMPVVLAVLITAIQNNTFKLVNDNKIPLLISNQDTSVYSRQFIDIIKKTGAFDLKEISETLPEQEIEERMYKKDALTAVIIPADFSHAVKTKAGYFSKKVFSDLGLTNDSLSSNEEKYLPLEVLYHPVLQESFRQSIQGSLRAALQLLENKLLIRELYSSVNEKKSPESTEDEMQKSQTVLKERIISRNDQGSIPNATQHNIPAWTVFAMFFVVVSMGSAIVKEKLTGSFVRLRTIPSSYIFSLFSKQIVYLL
ncbi:MAG: ABC transporter permease, partial [Bacteroidia bacterium]|nr:ABC transporter permease [Bacteroidia bacterium]